MKIFRIIVTSILITIIIFYWTIARHEGSHAIMAYLEGSDIQELRLFPGVHEELGFYFAYVKHSEGTGWLTEAAPYIADLLLILITASVLLWKKNIKFFNAIILLGFVSPIIDLVYNYQGGFWREGNDVFDLLSQLPDVLVHLSFIMTILFSILALRFFRIRHKKIIAKIV